MAGENGQVPVASIPESFSGATAWVKRHGPAVGLLLTALSMLVVTTLWFSYTETRMPVQQHNSEVRVLKEVAGVELRASQQVADARVEAVERTMDLAFHADYLAYRKQLRGKAQRNQNATRSGMAKPTPDITTNTNQRQPSVTG